MESSRIQNHETTRLDRLIDNDRGSPSVERRGKKKDGASSKRIGGGSSKRNRRNATDDRVKLFESTPRGWNGLLLSCAAIAILCMWMLGFPLSRGLLDEVGQSPQIIMEKLASVELSNELVLVNQQILDQQTELLLENIPTLQLFSNEERQALRRGAIKEDGSNRKTASAAETAAIDLLIAKRQLELLLEEKSKLRASGNSLLLKSNIGATAKELEPVKELRASDTEALSDYARKLHDVQRQLDSKKREAELRGAQSTRMQNQISPKAGHPLESLDKDYPEDKSITLHDYSKNFAAPATDLQRVGASTAILPSLPPVTQANSKMLYPFLEHLSMYAAPLSRESFSSNPAVKVDITCPRHTQLKDPCACQITCGQDRSCRGAAKLCKELTDCSLIKQNGNKNKPVATLKKEIKELFHVGEIPRKWSSSFGAGQRTFLIIGEQKCGTTQMYDALKSKSWIRAPASNRKELHMFDHYHHLDACRISDYLSKFRKGIPFSSFVGEATPDYLADPIAARLSSTLLPASKIIVMIRDPIRRAHAAWDQNRRAGPEMRSFGEAVRDEWRVAVRCREVIHNLVGWVPRNTSVLASGLFTSEELTRTYVEECVHYIDGLPGDCWINKKYDQKPACKRYLYKASDTSL